jgi:hypothetical protein
VNSWRVTVPFVVEGIVTTLQIKPLSKVGPAASRKHQDEFVLNPLDFSHPSPGRAGPV